MKYVILFILIINTSFADCDWSTIKNNTDGTYIYSKECHIEVGKVLEERDRLVSDKENLNKALELKDLALETSFKRVELWKDYSYRTEDRLISYEKGKKYSDWAFFGLGIATVLASGWALGQVSK